MKTRPFLHFTLIILTLVLHSHLAQAGGSTPWGFSWGEGDPFRETVPCHFTGTFTNPYFSPANSVFNVNCAFRLPPKNSPFWTKFAATGKYPAIVVFPGNNGNVPNTSFILDNYAEGIGAGTDPNERLIGFFFELTHSYTPGHSPGTFSDEPMAASNQAVVLLGAAIVRALGINGPLVAEGYSRGASTVTQAFNFGGELPYSVTIANSSGQDQPFWQPNAQQVQNTAQYLKSHPQNKFIAINCDNDPVAPLANAILEKNTMQTITNLANFDVLPGCGHGAWGYMSYFNTVFNRLRTAGIFQ